jgi:hypothetical protein
MFNFDVVTGPTNPTHPVKPAAPPTAAPLAMPAPAATATDRDINRETARPLADRADSRRQ